MDVSGYVVGSDRIVTQTKQAVRAFAAKGDPLRQRLKGLRHAIHDDLERGTYDIAASHFALFAYPLRKQLRNVPFVVHFHGPWAAESRAEGENKLIVRAKWALERSVYKRSRSLYRAFRSVSQIAHRAVTKLVRMPSASCVGVLKWIGLIQASPSWKPVSA